MLKRNGRAQMKVFMKMILFQNGHVGQLNKEP
jgi:hypothetical protein